MLLSDVGSALALLAGMAHHSHHSLTLAPKTQRRTIVAFAATAVLVASVGCSDSNPANGGNIRSSAALPAGEAPTDEVAADLTLLREEEKLARDVYLTLGEEWKIAIFSNIAQAEQRHMDRVGELLERYKLADPVVNDQVGAFTDPGYKTLFTELVTLGRESASSALRVGATIEELDINDLRAMQGRATSADVAQVHASLSCGSRNHLRSFVGQLQSQEQGFTPQYLSVDEVDSILSAARESCGGSGR